MSACLTLGTLPREFPDRTECVSEVPAMLGSEASAATAVGREEKEEGNDGDPVRPGTGLSVKLSPTFDAGA